MDLKTLYVRYDLDSGVITEMKDIYGNISNFDFLCSELYGGTEYDGAQVKNNKIFSTDRSKAGNITVPSKISDCDLILVAEDDSAGIRISGTSIVGVNYHGSNLVSELPEIQNLKITEDNTCIAQKQFRSDYFKNSEHKQIHGQYALTPSKLVDTVTQYLATPIKATASYVAGGKPGDFLLNDGTILAAEIYTVDWFEKVVGVVISYDAEHDQGFAIAKNSKIGKSDSERFCSVRTEDIKGIDTYNKDFSQASGGAPLTEDSLAVLKFLNYKKDNAAIAAQAQKGTAEFPAYKYCSEYSDINFEAGKWFLPTVQLAYLIYENQKVIASSLNSIFNSFVADQFNIWSCIKQVPSEQFGVSLNSELTIASRYVDRTSYYNGVFPTTHFHQSKTSNFVAGDQIGDFLLNDGRILAKSAYKGYWLDKIEGVILSVTGEEGSKQYEVVSLNELKGSGTDYYFSSEKVLIPDMDTSDAELVQDPPLAPNNPLLAFNDYRKNNAAIAAQLSKGTGTYPAYSYCAAYETESITKGNWFLPTVVQLNKLYENRELLNDSFKLVFGDLLSKNEDTWYMSCIQGSAETEWMIYFGPYKNPFLVAGAKLETKKVRATRPIGIYTQSSN